MKSMGKKGVSPLIATVLIIALTVALTVFLMNWAFGFFKERTSETSRTTKEQLKCATAVDFDFDCTCIQVTSTGAGNCTFNLANNANLKYDTGIKVRTISSDGKIGTTVTSTSGVPALPTTLDAFSSFSTTIDTVTGAVQPFDVEILVPSVFDPSLGQKFECGSLAKLRKQCVFVKR